MRLSVKILIIVDLFLIFGSVFFYFFILPPRVMSLSPSIEDENVSIESSFVINFDKPVKRKKLQHSITPEAYGEWKFEDSLVNNHLYCTLTFTPVIDFSPETQYQVKIENIISPLGIGSPGSFSFSFKTESIYVDSYQENEKKNDISQDIVEEDLVDSGENCSEESAQASIEPEPQITLLNIPLDWQDYSLSCEAASLKMALAYKNIYVSEDDIMDKIGYDLTIRKDGIWGNPYESYVGDIDGKMCTSGYGVYWQPVAEAANNWREAESFSEGRLENLVKELKLGNPVVIWGTLPVNKIHDCSWHTSDGKYIKAFQETHVRLVIGFIGEPENPSHIILNDPLSGRLYWETPFFLTNWSAFDYSGVVLR